MQLTHSGARSRARRKDPRGHRRRCRSLTSHPSGSAPMMLNMFPSRRAGRRAPRGMLLRVGKPSRQLHLIGDSARVLSTFRQVSLVVLQPTRSRTPDQRCSCSCPRRNVWSLARAPRLRHQRSGHPTKLKFQAGEAQRGGRFDSIFSTVRAVSTRLFPSAQGVYPRLDARPLFAPRRGERDRQPRGAASREAPRSGRHPAARSAGSRRQWAWAWLLDAGALEINHVASLPVHRSGAVRRHRRAEVEGPHDRYRAELHPEAAPALPSPSASRTSTTSRPVGAGKALR